MHCKINLWRNFIEGCIENLNNTYLRMQHGQLIRLDEYFFINNVVHATIMCSNKICSLKLGLMPINSIGGVVKSIEVHIYVQCVQYSCLSLY